MTDKKFFFEQFADDFDKKMYMYDTNTRIQVIFDDLLKNENLQKKRLLDAGCGTGWFSKRAHELGAEVTALDVGEKLLSKVREKCNVTTVIGDLVDLKFEDNFFDYVISSEVIEHTINPRKAVSEIVRVTKIGGVIALTTPNSFWYFSVWLANKFHLRPYEGYENWVSYYKLKNWFTEDGCEVERHRGIHIAPLFFHHIFLSILKYIDRFGEFLGPIMLNIAIKARKKL